MRELAAKLHVPVPQVVRMVRDTTAERRLAPAARSAPPTRCPDGSGVQPPRDELAAFALLVSHPRWRPPTMPRAFSTCCRPGVRQVYRTACKPCRPDNGRTYRLLDACPDEIRASVGRL